MAIFAASPPWEVSLYLVFMSWAVSHMVLMTASRLTLALVGSLSSAILAAVMAFTAPMELRSMQGT